MRKGKERGGAPIDTLIGPGTTVTGDLSFTGGLHLEGRIEGNIAGGDAHAVLDVSEAGSVVGEVTVARATVNGTVEGDLHATDSLVLGNKARIDGNVFYHVLEMAAGAKVNGKLVFRARNAEPLALEHRSAERGEGGD